MLSGDDLVHIELDPTFYVDLLIVSSSQSLRAEGGRFYHTGLVPQLGKSWVFASKPQCFCSFYDVRKVEVHYVVACYDVRIHFSYKVPKRVQHVNLALKLKDLSPCNRSTCVQVVNSSQEWFLLSMYLADTCDLDYWVFPRFREPSSIGGTLNVKRENPERSYLSKLSS